MHATGKRKCKKKSRKLALVARSDERAKKDENSHAECIPGTIGLQSQQRTPAKQMHPR